MAGEFSIVGVPVIKLEPGDRVLINFGQGYDMEGDDVQNTMTELRERFPDVEFTALFGPENVVVDTSGRDALRAFEDPG